MREFLDTSVRTCEVLQACDRALSAGYRAIRWGRSKITLNRRLAFTSIRAESFRQLRTNLQFVDVDNPVKVVVVTSSVANEGKSSTATNMAISFSAAGSACFWSRLTSDGRELLTTLD